jgi:outer membrane protein OmpU
MKKVLIASTALVAATMLSAGAASASEKIKLNLGGFSKWFVVGAWQDDSFQANNNAAGAQGDYNNVDIKGNNEIFFGGSTTLDNGLKVGIDIQLEAGGNTETNTATGDVIDESYIWIEGGFGKFIVGSENNGAYLLHVTAPDAAGNWNEDGIITGNQSIARPGNVTGLLGGNTTAINADGDAEGITYVAPSFYGLTVGATYKPNSTEDNRMPTNLVGTGATASEIYGVGALYANTFGGVGVKVSGGWATYDLNVNGNGSKDGVNEYSVGTQLSYAGFTLGGSYRRQNADAAVAANDGYGWDIGLQYASGPYAISASYFKSELEGNTAVAGEDEIQAYQVSGKYNLGAGVDVLATIGHIEYNDEAGLPQDENKGWVVATGLSLAF